MKILLVDQNQDSLRTLERLVTKLGYEVLTAGSGRGAWKTWNHERPRMVVMNAVLPDMNGLDFCSAIRELEGDDYTYVIFVTDAATRAEVARGLEAGADAFLTLPLNEEEFVARLRAGERIVNRNKKDLSLLAMAKLAEFHNPDIGRHIRHVREFSRILAETIASRPDAPLGMSQTFVDQIYLASALHDLGNAGIPDHILTKPDILTSEEFEIVTHHTVIGFNSVCDALKHQPNAHYLKMAAEIALSHHEKYNGEGYPHGLKGEAIPFSARIVALADVYDALVSERPYRPAYTHEVTVEIIVNGRGLHFDPLVVAAFEDHHHRFEAIHAKSLSSSNGYEQRVPPALPYVARGGFNPFYGQSQGAIQMDDLALSLYAESPLSGIRHH